MKNKKQKTTLPSKIISALIAGLLGISSMATADVSDNEQQQSRVEEIVVTASKREESIMDVAQSVQYMSGEQLEGSGVQTLAEIVQMIPGVSQIGASAETYFNFRGTGANLANDSPVGFYIDGMPYYIVDSPVGPDTEMFDLESIQVLRGPQGTLYGQGALGGTVLITTAKPDLEQFRARVRAGASSMHDGGNGHTYDVSLSVPLIEGTLAASLTAGGSRDPGLAEGVDLPGSDLDENDRWYARLKVLWEPSDDLSITALIQHRDLEENESRALYSAFDPPILGRTGGVNGFTTTKVDMYGLNIEWDVGFATLTSSTSQLNYEYNRFLGASFADPNLGTFLITLGDNDPDIETFNQELRLTSNGDGEWDWIVGVNFTEGENPGRRELVTLEPLIFASTVADVDNFESEQLAVFGEISRSFMDGLITPLLGLRYFRDDRETQLLSTFELPGFSIPLETIDEEERFSLVSPRFNLRITPSDDMMFYLNISRGFRSGTFNSPGDVAGVLNTFGIGLDVAVPESIVTSYEVGGRFSLLNETLFLEPSLYLADYEDYQFAGTLGGSTMRISIEEVIAVGAEMLLRWNTPVEGLSLSMIGSLNSTEIEDLDAAIDGLLAGIDDGEQLPYVPEWDVRAGVDYEWPVMGEWTASASAAFYRRDGTTDFNLPLRSSAVSDLSLRLALTNQNWKVTLWGKNLTDDEGPSGTIGGNFVRWDRRSLGVMLEYTFN